MHVCKREFDVQGQPQCLKKLTTVGFPSCVGSPICDVEGALSPTAGVVPNFTADGDIQDQNSLCQVIVKSF